MANDLLPCPFCGGDGHATYRAEEGPNDLDTHLVFCKKHCGGSTRGHYSAQSAIDAWNQRVPPAPLIAERDALAAKLAEAVDALRPFAVRALGTTPLASDVTLVSPMQLRFFRRAAAIVKEHE